MSIFAKMPGILGNCFKTVVYKPLTVGHLSIVGFYITGFPVVPLVNRYFFQRSITIKKHMLNTLCLQFQMKLPDGSMRLNANIIPRNASNVFFIGLLMTGRNMVSATGIDLIIGTLNQPFLSFPS